MHNAPNLIFSRAVRRGARARLAIDGPSGCGKTFTALTAAQALAGGRPVALIDTERGSASLYSDLFCFDVLNLDHFDPRLYMRAIQAAESAGYAVIIIDSLSHAWDGEGGALDMVDKAAKRSPTANSFNAWKEITPIQRALVDAMLASPCHIIATMRAKMEYIQEKDEKSGRTVIRKVGMAPVQRQGMEYEFQVVADMDSEHNLTITKTRCPLLDNAAANRPTPAFFRPYADWLKSSAPPNQVPEPVEGPADFSTLPPAYVGRASLPAETKPSLPSSKEPIPAREPSPASPPPEGEPLAQDGPPSSQRSWSCAQVQALITAGHAKNPHNAVAMLNLSSLPVDAAPGLCAQWAASYRAIRDKNEGCGPARAAGLANALTRRTAPADQDGPCEPDDEMGPSAMTEPVLSPPKEDLDPGS